MSLTKEQFQKARDAGYSVEQIAGFEKKRMSENPEVVKGLFGNVPKDEFDAGKRNIVGNVFERPSAAIRGGLRGLSISPEKALEFYKRGAINPNDPVAEEGKMRQDLFNAMMDRSEASGNTFMAPFRAAVMNEVLMAGTNPAGALVNLATASGVGSAAKPVLGGLKKAADGLSKAADVLGNTTVGKNLAKMTRYFSRPVAFRTKTIQKVSEKAARAIEEGRSVLSQQYDNLLSKADNLDSKPFADALDEYAETFSNASESTKYRKMAAEVRNKGVLTGKEAMNYKNQMKINWRANADDAINSAKKATWRKLTDYINSNVDGLKDVGIKYKEFTQNADDVYSVILESGRPGTRNIQMAQHAKKIFGIRTPSNLFSYRQGEALKAVDAAADPKNRFLKDFYAWQRGKALQDVALRGAAGYGIYKGGKAVYGSVDNLLGE